MTPGENRCFNYGHVRKNPPVRFCPNCGEVVNDKIPIKQCSKESHTRRRMDLGIFCVDCGQPLTS